MPGEQFVCICTLNSMFTGLGFVRFMFDEMPVCICVLDSTMIHIAYTFLAKKPYLIQNFYIIVDKDSP